MDIIVTEEICTCITLCTGPCHVSEIFLQQNNCHSYVHTHTCAHTYTPHKHTHTHTHMPHTHTHM